MNAAVQAIYCDTTDKPQLFFNIAHGSLPANCRLIISCDQSGVIIMQISPPITARTYLQHLTTICAKWKIWLTSLIKRWYLF
jgi:hypothetical protein